MGIKNINGSICWDCGRSTDGSCPWAQRFEPVEGWTAESHMMPGTRTTPATVAYKVLRCPLFTRDSYGCGMFRIGSKEAEKFELALQGV